MTAQDLHLSFLEQLARNTSGQRSAQELAAGLVMLRMVDAVRGGDHPDAWGLREVRDCIANLDGASVVKTTLARIAQLLATPSFTTEVLVLALVDYARALESAAEWLLAIDVYATALRSIGPAPSQLVMHCWLRIGHCHHTVGSQRTALAAFRRAARFASRVGDKAGYLLARIGENKRAVIRGNLSLARRRLRWILRQARSSSLRDIECKALHELADVAYRNSDYRLGLRFMHRAQRLCVDELQRDRIAADIAHGWMNVGLLGAAQYGYTALAFSARSRYIRWSAHANLLECTSLLNDISAFQRHAGWLAKESLPPHLRTHVQLILADGYGRFGDLENRKQQLRRGLALASEHGFGQLIFQFEQALGAIESIQGAARRDLPGDLPSGTNLSERLEPSRAAEVSSITTQRELTDSGL